MKPETKQKLVEAQLICDEEGRSTEYMIQFMQDYAGVDFDCVINFLYQNRQQGQDDDS